MKSLLSYTGMTALVLSTQAIAIERLTPIEEPGVKAEKVAVKAQVNKAWFGVVGRPVGKALAAQLGIEHGVTLELVAADGSAGKAGIKKFDVITKIGDKDIKSMQDLRSVMKKAEVNQTLEVQVFSGGELATHQVTLDAHPGNFSKQAKAAGSSKGKARIRPLNGDSFSRSRLPQALHGFGMADAEREKIEKMMEAQFQQMQKQFADAQVDPADIQALKNQGGGFSSSSSFSSSMTLMDDEGSIQIKSSGKSGKHVTVTDTEGTVLFSGPYQTEEDKKAVPAELRARIDALGVDDMKNRFSFSFGK